MIGPQKYVDEIAEIFDLTPKNRENLLYASLLLGVLLIWIRVGQEPTALAMGAGGGCLDIFTLVYHFSFLSPSLWKTARNRLKYCLKGPLSPKQPTNNSFVG